MSEGEYFIVGSWDELGKEMRKHEKIANEAILPKQREIVYGSYWIRAWGNMLVFGRVLSREASETGQTRETVRALRDAYERGYRFSRSYSVLDIHGELGDVHISVVWPIREEEFEAAQENNFRATNQPWEYEMLLRCQQEVQADMAANPRIPRSPQEES